MAAKLALTTTTTVDVKLQTTTKMMILDRCKEYQRLAQVVKGEKARQDRIRDEIEDLLVKAGKGAELADGLDIEGHKIKMVCGSRSVRDDRKLVELGCDPEWIKEATATVPNEPYIKLTAPEPEEKA